jgi:hypothetical protein
MARKLRTPDFATMMDTLRAHSFQVDPYPAVPNAMLVTKNGAGAVLVPGKDGQLAFWERPGAVFGVHIARLLDRGYQKFLRTTKFEFPATAAQLQSIHRFSEELNLLSGAISLYNEALGTTSDVYQYDRLKGRDAGEKTPVQPWQLADGH